MEVNKKEIDRILNEFNKSEDSLIPILLQIQNLSEEKYISKKCIVYISKEMKLNLSRIYEVITFFSAINTEPKGKYHIQICESSVCKINKIDYLKDYLEDILSITVGEVTEDKLFSLDFTPCFGACDVAPAMRINKKVYGNLTIDKLKDILFKLGGVKFE